jgi:Asp-tRNA(Asn)/Glu-tRNA(Gln) amidotransferase A subunit family amidase
MKLILQPAAAIACLALAGVAHAQPAPMPTLLEAATAIRAHTTTSCELVERSLRAADLHQDLHAFITIDRIGARRACAEADRAVAQGRKLGRLHGVPVAIKDNILVKGLPFTGGTRALQGYVATQDAPAVARLRAEGAIVIGKLNLHELAFGATGNNFAYGAVGNAYDPSRFAGGSSGGSGAAVGARIVPAALGTDTGGSVRIPAALNGIVGLRPTAGRYSGEGVLPVSTARDTIGPLAAQRGRPGTARRDPFGQPRRGAAQAARGPAPGRSARGLLRQRGRGHAPRLRCRARQTQGRGRADRRDRDPAAARGRGQGRAGHRLRSARGHRRLSREAQDRREPRPVGRRHREPRRGGGFSQPHLSASAPTREAYETALKVERPKLQALLRGAFESNRLDALLYPVTLAPALPIRGTEMSVTINGRTTSTLAAYIANTGPTSTAVLPGVTVPIALSDEGLPIGLAIDGLWNSDRALLAIAMGMETIFPALPAPKQ